jgi:hypothetical protein
MKRFLQLLSLTVMAFAIFTVSIQAQTGPGGVGGHDTEITEGSPINALWLRAGDLSLQDGAFVTSWGDVSGYNHFAVPGIAGKEGIIFETNKINGFPWVTFQGINHLKVANNDVLDGGEGYGLFVVAKRNPIVVADKYEPHYNTIVAKRAHWNAWSHIPPIPMSAEGLQHAYELRWDRTKTADEQLYLDTVSVTAFMNGNLPDGAGADVFSPISSTVDIDASYIISHVYSNHEDSYGSMVRINGTQANRPGRGEGNPNPLRVGPVVKSTKDLWIGGAQYDPPGSHANDTDQCPTCTATGLLEGSIAEVILYKGTLWHTHIFLVENYLSLKYDLPIDTAKYYSHDTYKMDFVGIGNEKGDDKKHIKSESHALIIEEQNESLDAAKEYLFAAHDGADFEWTNNDLDNTAFLRWGRSWRIEKMGAVDAQISFNFITAGLNLVNSQASKLRLAYRENLDESFSVITDIVPTRVVKTLNFIVPDASLKTGYYTVMSGYDPTIDVPVQDVFTQSMKVYPSPAQNQINVSFANFSTGDVIIRFIDLTGREISKTTDFKTDDHFEKIIPISHLNNGVYFVEISIDGNRAVKRFVKQ